MAKKKSSASSARVSQTKRNEKTILDDQIDYSDIPPLTDEELKQFKPFHHFFKKLPTSKKRKAA